MLSKEILFMLGERQVLFVSSYNLSFFKKRSHQHYTTTDISFLWYNMNIVLNITLPWKQPCIRVCRFYFITVNSICYFLSLKHVSFKLDTFTLYHHYLSSQTKIHSPLSKRSISSSILLILSLSSSHCVKSFLIQSVRTLCMWEIKTLHVNPLHVR